MKSILLIAAMMLCTAAFAESPVEPSQRAVETYVYLIDGSGNKVLVSTQIWRNDPKYDDRSFHRFLDVLTALEKRGFRIDPKVRIDDWEKPEPFVRCYIYLEDRQAGRTTKQGTTTGSRVWCSQNGASELELDRSDAPRHTDEVMHHFDVFFDRARKNVRR